MGKSRVANIKLNLPVTKPARSSAGRAHIVPGDTFVHRNGGIDCAVDVEPYSNQHQYSASNNEYERTLHSLRAARSGYILG